MVIKTCIVGDGAVGKTCLLIVFSKGDFPKDYVPTVFDNFTTDITLDGQTHLLGMWDTAGQEEFDTLRPLSYPGTQVFLLVFSTVLRASFENISAKWVPEIKHHCPTTPFVLIGAKIDLRDDDSYLKKNESIIGKPITTMEGESLKKSIGAMEYFECSAKKNLGVTDIFEKTVKRVLTLAPQQKKKAGCLLL